MAVLMYLIVLIAAFDAAKSALLLDWKERDHA